MEPKDLEYFEKLLLKEREHIQIELQNTEEKIRVSQQESSSDLSLYPTHEADIATDAESREGSVLIVENKAAILGKIDRALKKISNNEYGVCENCGKEIERERLKCIPYVEFCVKCEEERKG
ncbi:MAG: TraR/DksA C4-type zinc finger protein [bacterium]|nr:TraR/DksA C4-type zinc finger protein [bacterium]